MNWLSDSIFILSSAIRLSSNPKKFKRILVSKSVFLLPLIVVLRFSFLFLERMNLELLNLDVQKNLRNYLMEEVYKLGNMSISDIYFYVNQVGTQVSMFYKSFALLLNSLLQVIGYSIFLLITDINTFSIFLFGSFPPYRIAGIKPFFLSLLLALEVVSFLRIALMFVIKSEGYLT